MPGTLEHKRIRVLAFYRWLGVKIQPKIPAFKPVKALPEAYDDKQLSALFSAAPLRHRLLYTLLLQSGLREGEAASLRYCDLADDAVLVRPHNGFVPKDSEERAIPVPRALIKQLRALPVVNGSELLFPNRDGSHCKNLRRDLYRIAERAGLDKREFWLHRVM